MEEIKFKVANMPYMELSYINEREVGIWCTYACLRAGRLLDIKDFLGLSDLYVSWCPSMKGNKGMLLVGKL